jgi:hypothetical protein
MKCEICQIEKRERDATTMIKLTVQPYDCFLPVCEECEIEEGSRYIGPIQRIPEDEFTILLTHES